MSNYNWEILDNGNERTYVNGYVCIVGPSQDYPFQGAIKDGAGKIIYKLQGESSVNIKHWLVSACIEPEGEKL